MKSIILKMPIRLKIISISVVTLLLICAFIVTYFPYQQKKEMSTAMQNKLHGMSEMIAFGVGVGMHTSDFQLVVETIKWAKKDPEVVYIIALDEKKEILGLFNPTGLQLNLLFLLENDDLIEFNGDQYHLAKTPIIYENTKYGQLIIVTTLEHYYERIDKISQTALIISVSIFSICILLSIILSSSITKPLLSLKNATNKIANGDYNVKIDIKTEDEIGVLGNSFMIMTEKIKLLISKLEGDLKDEINISKRAKSEVIKLSRAVEQSPLSIIITDINGLMEYVNPRLISNTGYQRAELIGKNPRIFASGELKENVYKELWETILDGKEWQGEFHNKKKNGELFWESASISPILDENGKMNHFIAIKEDITERKQAQNELLEAKLKAEESDNLKSEFLAQMSHEIRTPLNILLGSAEYLNEIINKENNAEIQLCFKGINSASKRIIRTIDLILDMSKLNTIGYEPNFQIINLDENIFSKLLPEFKIMAEQKGIELIYSCVTKNLSVTADEYSVYQIFSNLVDNSVKYTQKGKIEIMIFEDPSHSIVVQVKDTGVGIGDNFKNSMFSNFLQEEQGYHRRYDGNGLGLALVKKYCEINNAKINFESEKNVGTNFRVEFRC
jgi:PAS domain S-box-containing protein